MANKETNKKENSKNKKSFFKDFKAELKRVVWPTPKQLINNTIAVVTIVLLTAAIVFVLDVVFEAINKHGINKVKEVMATNNTTVENSTTENGTSGEESSNENNNNTTESNQTGEEKVPENNTTTEGENTTENTENKAE